MWFDQSVEACVHEERTKWGKKRIPEGFEPLVATEIAFSVPTVIRDLSFSESSNESLLSMVAQKIPLIRRTFLEI